MRKIEVYDENNNLETELESSAFVVVAVELGEDGESTGIRVNRHMQCHLLEGLALYSALRQEVESMGEVIGEGLPGGPKLIKKLAELENELHMLMDEDDEPPKVEMTEDAIEALTKIARGEDC